jgi:hypothetical protein
MFPKGVFVGIAVVVAIVLGVVGIKLLADRAASERTDALVADVHQVLEGTTPQDFLDFNAGSEVEGSVAEEVASREDFVSVDARSERAVIRFQPEGWWQGFTERCVVGVVGSEGVEVIATKTACVRVDPASY